jgi:hypothetical protein
VIAIENASSRWHNRAPRRAAEIGRAPLQKARVDQRLQAQTIPGRGKTGNGDQQIALQADSRPCRSQPVGVLSQGVNVVQRQPRRYGVWMSSR